MLTTQLLVTAVLIKYIYKLSSLGYKPSFTANNRVPTNMISSLTSPILFVLAIVVQLPHAKYPGY